MATKKTREKRRTRQASGLDMTGGTVDPHALVQYVLRESYLQRMEDVKYYAEKVKYFNQLKKAIREYLQALRCVRSKVAARARQRGLDVACPNEDEAKELAALLQQHALAFAVGSAESEIGLPDRVPTTDVDSLDKFAEKVALWEEKLATIGDDAQLANVDLQNVMQQVQQLLQMLSNVSKMTHDNMMSIIRKIGG